jgi:hypothetical protein
MDTVAKYARMFPMKRMIRLPKKPYFICHDLLYKIFFIIFNVIPAFVLENITKLCNFKPMPIVSIIRKSFCTFKVLGVFSSLVKYDDTNLVLLFSKMTKEDQINFPCAVRLPMRDEYLKNLVIGMNKYLMKETNEDLNEAKKKVRIFLIVDYFLDAVFCASIYFVIRALLRFFQLKY